MTARSRKKKHGARMLTNMLSCPQICSQRPFDTPPSASGLWNVNFNVDWTVHYRFEIVYCGLLILNYKMKTVNFKQLTIGLVFDQGLYNMDWTVSYLWHPKLWSDCCATCNYRLPVECEL